MATSVNPSTGAVTGSKPPARPASAPLLPEDEIRARLARWEELSTEEQKFLTRAIRALPPERFKALEKEFGLHKMGSGLELRLPFPSFKPKEDLLVPRGLLDARKTAAQQPDSPAGQAAKASVETALNPRGLVAPPKWLQEIAGPRPDPAAIDRLAAIYTQLTGRELPSDPEGKRTALFRDPAFQSQSPAAAVAASMAFNAGLGNEGPKAEFRYRNAAGQERKAVLGGDAVALASNKTPGFLPHVQKVAIAAEESGVPWQLIYGVVRALTGWDPGKVSRLGAGPEGTTAGSASDRESESDTAAASQGAPDTPGGIKHVAEALDAYFEELGDWGLAVMAIRDPEAARQLKATGRVASKDAYQFVQQALFGPNGGPGSEDSVVKLGWDTDGFDLEAYEMAGKMVGDGGKPVQLPDRESMAQQVRGLFRNMLLRDASDQEVNGFISIIEGQIIAAQQLADVGAGNPYADSSPNQPTPTIRDVDPAAQLQSQIRGSAEFKDLYRSKPEWMDEGQYTSQVAGQAAQVTGETPDTEALKVGLQTGTGDAYTGYLQGRAAGKNTVSFRERLYAASQILNGL